MNFPYVSFFLSLVYISLYISCIENIPVRIEVVARLVSQRGAKVKAAFVDEKFDELSKKKKEIREKEKRERKKNRYICRGWNTMCVDKKKCNAFSPGD